MNKIPPDSPVGNYLLARGIDLGFASGKRFVGNQGSDSKIELVKERFEAAEYLGIKEEQLKWDLDSELLCFPLYPWGWLTKRFPESMSGSGKGFRATLGLKGQHPIFIPESTWAARRDATKPLFITEGPVKALALLQAGVLSIGLIGTYASEFCDGRRLRQLQKHLREHFEWFGRRVYFAFDADRDLKPECAYR
jgi:hypothetical protein